MNIQTEVVEHEHTDRILARQGYMFITEKQRCCELRKLYRVLHAKVAMDVLEPTQSCNRVFVFKSPALTMGLYKRNG